MTTQEIHGLTVLMPSHPVIRQLKKDYFPCIHGHRLWKSSLTMLDYLSQQKEIPDRVMDLGCGWGLSGIYMARKGASVLGVDADSQVFPFMQAQASVNGAKIHAVHRKFSQLNGELENVDWLIGSDICFWPSLTNDLFRLFGRALSMGAKRIVLADPGRSTFKDLCRKVGRRWGGEVIDGKLLVVIG